MFDRSADVALIFGVALKNLCLKRPILNTGHLIKLPIIGHDGHGCQQLSIDLERKAVIAYVTNGVKMGTYDTCRTYVRLHKAVYDFRLQAVSDQVFDLDLQSLQCSCSCLIN
ncbi:unnamed protein product [Cylicostephanus goldi]|uniref:Uncharacterized protein n=1 Tax=Cylicostephanus goldi TaxID=71465 RepID=A0A3P6SY67_CYLGO|nr:unnamed protein product [Cylicostephanus goldi]